MTELSLTVVPKELYYVEMALVERQANEIKRLQAEVELWKDRCDSLVADMQRMERSLDEAWRYDERDH